MKKTLTLLTAIFAIPIAQAATVFVDIGNTSTATATGSDFYNTIVSPSGSAAATPLATGGSHDLSDLTDIDGTTNTGIDVSLSSYNNGSGQLRSNFANGGALIHDPVAGIEAFATADGIWMNNHNTNGTGAGNEFGFVVTFSDLTDAAYNIELLASSSNLNGSWAVTTGTGDPDSEAYSGTDDVLSWTDVAPVGGVIVLTNTVTPTAVNFQNAAIQFVSIQTVPEPGSLALLGLGGLCMLKRRRREA